MKEIEKRFVAVRVDVTKEGNPDAHVMKDVFQSGTMPTVGFIDSAGNLVLEETVQDGAEDPYEFLEALERIE